MSTAPDQPLRALPEYSRREIQFMAIHERIVHLDDLILRRTIMALMGQLSRDVLAESAEALASALGWTPERTRQEIGRTENVLAEVHGVKSN